MSPGPKNAFSSLGVRIPPIKKYCSRWRKFFADDNFFRAPYPFQKQIPFFHHLATSQRQKTNELISPKVLFPSPGVPIPPVTKHCSRWTNSLRTITFPSKKQIIIDSIFNLLIPACLAEKRYSNVTLADYPNST